MNFEFVVVVLKVFFAIISILALGFFIFTRGNYFLKFIVCFGILNANALIYIMHSPFFSFSTIISIVIYAYYGVVFVFRHNRKEYRNGFHRATIVFSITVLAIFITITLSIPLSSDGVKDFSDFILCFAISVIYSEGPETIYDFLSAK